MRRVNVFEGRLAATLAGVLLLGLAGCGGESPDPDAARDEVASDEVAAEEAETEPAADEEESTPTSDASGIPSEHYSALDELELPASGSGVLVLGTETVHLDGVSCPAPEEVEAERERSDVFRFGGEATGTMADGSTLTVAALRGLGDPARDDYSEHSVYEVDMVTLQIRDEVTSAPSDISTSVKAVRPLVGGPDRHTFGDSDGGLPMVKVRDDAQALTVIATAETTSGDRSGPLGGPFTLAMTCT